MNEKTINYTTETVQDFTYTAETYLLGRFKGSTQSIQTVSNDFLFPTGCGSNPEQCLKDFIDKCQKQIDLLKKKQREAMELINNSSFY